MAETSQPVIITFQGGLNTRVRTADISPFEATQGRNFDIDPEFAALKKRKSFDFIADAGGGRAIKGIMQQVSPDGTTSTLVQTDELVVLWDQASNFSLVDAVSPNSRLRGTRTANFALTDDVIITDLALETVVKKWDGNNFDTLEHSLTGDFYAKYARVMQNRAYYANIRTTTRTPHVVLGSAVDDFENLSILDKPSSALGDDAAFFLTTPDLRPINGFDQAFGKSLVSTQKGQLFELTGSSAQDFAFSEFYFGSAVSGEEALVNIGNDIMMGLPSRIESLSGVDNFGDVESNDLSRFIAPSLKRSSEWLLAYDRSRQDVYCIPNNSAVIWVFKKSAFDLNSIVSPWLLWDLDPILNLSKFTTVQTIIGPDGENDVVVAGTDDGRLIRLNGDGVKDLGTAPITMERTTGLIRGPMPQVADITGWINYRKKFATQITLTFMFGGLHEFDQSMTIDLPGTDCPIPVYGGNFYYNGANYYSSGFSGRISRTEDPRPAGQSNHFQVKISHTGSQDIQIEEIGFVWRSINPTAIHNL